ncbi:MAG TPA: DUF3244 domain-containing protein [Chitinophagales bacterium]|nr:DUF3244 domain-containing protein [Chitinophagales bacterium]
MKKVLFSVVIAFGFFSAVVANSSIISKRIIDVFIEGYVLFANSDAKSGKILTIEIYDSQNNVVLTQKVVGSKTAVDLSGLPAGQYEAEIDAQKDQIWYPFSL